MGRFSFSCNGEPGLVTPWRLQHTIVCDLAYDLIEVIRVKSCDYQFRLEQLVGHAFSLCCFASQSADTL